MSSAKEIKNKIRSIESTRKITSAMEMVAASKMRKAQQRVLASRPYMQRIKQVIDHIVHGNLEYKHRYLVTSNTRPKKNVGFIVVSSDRGLCGGLNNNLFKKVLHGVKAAQDAGNNVVLFTIGKKAETFFARYNANIAASVHGVGDIPRIKDLVGIIKVVLDSFDAADLDQVYFAYNRFVSTIVQSPVLDTLLPIGDPVVATEYHSWDYIYEPNPHVLLDTLLKRYIETLIYQGVVENVGCEQAARMIAMQSATDNAQELIDEFKLKYNKARQAAITKELAEIVAGAAAV